MTGKTLSIRKRIDPKIIDDGTDTGIVCIKSGFKYTIFL